MHWDPTSNILTVETPHALIQAVGYLKYALRQHGPVLFRGQNKLYPSMTPSLFRSIKTTGGMSEREKKVIEYTRLATTSGAFIGKMPSDALEPLLQHYGIKTRWIDLVDNAWTALWFACQNSLSTGPISQYLHFAPSESENAYIILMQGGQETTEANKPGFLTSKNSIIIDLRRATPSTYLRPHAQHGLLLRRRAYSEPEHMDLSDFVVGIICAKTAKAKDWLGFGALTATHHIFPPPYYDEGYRAFLKRAPLGTSVIGSIQHIGA
ncbi:FRG domain-containing protein [Myxococcus sp. CA056]|nr:FRG domain-containing protein [Myxococcus sp. CA056]